MGRLKEELEKKFPGKIPASLQRLFKGTQLLPSEITLEEASEVSKETGGYISQNYSSSDPQTVCCSAVLECSLL